MRALVAAGLGSRTTTKPFGLSNTAYAAAEVLLRSLFLSTLHAETPVHWVNQGQPDEHVKPL